MKPQTSLIQPGAAAPGFELPRPGGGRAGLRWLIEGGRTGLLIFYKMECPTCRLAFPFFKRIHDSIRQHESDLRMLAVAQNAPADVPAFMERYQATFETVTEDAPWTASNAYAITHVPTLFLVNETGIVLRTTVGFNRKEFDAILHEMMSRATPGLSGGKLAAVSLFTDSDAGVPVLQPG